MKSVWVVVFAIGFSAVASACDTEGSVEVVYKRYSNSGTEHSIELLANDRCASVRFLEDSFVVERCGDRCFSGQRLGIYVFPGSRAPPTFDYSDPRIKILGHEISVNWYVGQYGGDQRVWLAFNETRGVVGISIGDAASPLFVLSGRCGLWAKHDCYEHGSDERRRLLVRERDEIRKSLLEIEERINKLTNEDRP